MAPVRAQDGHATTDKGSPLKSKSQDLTPFKGQCLYKMVFIKFTLQGLNPTLLLDHTSRRHAMDLMCGFEVATTGFRHKGGNQQLLWFLRLTSTPKCTRQRFWAGLR